MEAFLDIFDIYLLEAMINGILLGGVLALLALGCELGQGYGIARPMPADRIPEWVATWHPPASWLGNLKF